MRQRWVLAPFRTGRFQKRKEGCYGEFDLNLVLDVVALLLVALLGFMPLIVIHWASHDPRLRVMRPRHLSRLVQSVAIIKTSLLILLTDWLHSGIV